MKKEFLNIKHAHLFLLINFLLITVLILRDIYYMQNGVLGNHNDSGLTEWLINYQGGFGKRGLPGEIFYQLNNYVNIQANYLWIVICLSSYFILLYFFLKKIKNIFSIELVTSTIVLGMPVYTGFLWKKDVFGILLLLFCLQLFKLRSLFSLKFILINLISIIALLSHETFIFYGFAPLYFISFFLWNKKNNLFKKFFKSAFFYSPTIFICITVLFEIGSSSVMTSFERAHLIHHSWNSLWLKIEGSIPDTPGGSLHYLSYVNLENAFFWELNIFERPITFLIWFFLIFLCFIFIINMSFSASLKNRILLFKILFSQLLFVSPLFLMPVTGDWSRWIFFWTASSLAIFLFKFKYWISEFKYFDGFLKILLNSKIFNYKLKNWKLFLIGFPYVNHMMSPFNYFMVTPIGKLLAGSYKLLLYLCNIF